MKVQVCPKAGKGIIAAAVALGALAGGPIQSQAAEGPKMGGHVESTFNASFTKKGATKTNELRSYDAKANTFLLNTAHVTLAGNGTEKLEYTVELDAGSDATVNKDAAIGAGYVDLQEAYATYSLTDMVGLTGGKFVTFQGIEVIEGPANPTVSRGYLFGLAEAFTHTGMFLEVAPADMLSIKLGAANDWDVMVDTDDKKTVISRVGIDLGDPVAFGVSTYLGGAVSDLSIDVTGASNVIADMPINFQFIYGKLDDSKWWGAGLQPVYSLSDTMALGLRYEIWKPDAAKAGTAKDLTAHNFTVAPAWKPVEGFMLRPEYRIDLANEEIFTKDSNKGETSKNNMTVSLGLSYEF